MSNRGPFWVFDILGFGFMGLCGIIQCLHCEYVICDLTFTREPRIYFLGRLEHFVPIPNIFQGTKMKVVPREVGQQSMHV
jgi:hypothetical protein